MFDFLFFPVFFSFSFFFEGRGVGGGGVRGRGDRAGGEGGTQ